MVSHQQYIDFKDEQALDKMARNRLRLPLSVDDIIKGMVTGCLKRTMPSKTQCLCIPRTTDTTYANSVWQNSDDAPGPWCQVKPAVPHLALTYPGGASRG